MARRCFPTCFYVFTACLVAAESPTYGLKGQEVKLNPLISGLPDQILWMHNGHKVVEFNGNEQHVYETYENRTNLDWHSAQLHITDLRSEDSGVYEVEVFIYKNLIEYQFNLLVIDRVAKPTITCEMNSDKSSEVSGLLMCTTESEKPQFEWSSRGDVQYGPELNISLGGELDEQTYSCRVSNALSNETTTFVAKDCYTDEKNVALVAGLTSTFIVVIVVGILLYVYRHKGSQKEEAQGDEDKPLLELWEAGNNLEKSNDEPENSFSSSPCDETPSHLDQNSISSSAEDTKELPKVAETEVLQYSNESDPAGELADKMSDPESSAAPEHTDKKSDVADVSHNSPNMASVDSAGENKEDVSSVQVKRETDTNFRECDFSGMENKNEPPQEQQPCAVIEHYDSEPTTDDSDASSEGAHSSEENQEECRHVPGEAEIMLSVKTLRSFWENR